MTTKGPGEEQVLPVGLVEMWRCHTHPSAMRASLSYHCDEVGMNIDLTSPESAAHFSNVPGA
jgi:hypothetical protein